MLLKAGAMMNAADQILATIDASDVPSANVGDLGFTVYASLAGDYCVDFVRPHP